MSRQGGVYIGDFVEVTGCFDYLRKYQGAWAMLDEETMSEEISISQHLSSSMLLLVPIAFVHLLYNHCLGDAG